MKTLHRWFRSGKYSLLGHVDLRRKRQGHLGVVIVPPFGWEDVCSYRPLRFLARCFAANGIPTLRFDLPGTGDSSGTPSDPGLFEAWIESIDSAAAELRATTGVEDVAAVGIRLGAMLAATAAARGCNLQDLVLWGPSATGHAVLRELRAYSRLESTNSTGPPPVPGFEAGGFLLAPETQRALETLDLCASGPFQIHRALILSRDELPPDAKLIKSLKERNCDVTVKAGPGYSSMMALPGEALPPLQAGQLIVDYLKAGSTREQIGNFIPPSVSAPATAALESGSVFETIHTIHSVSSPMFGIVSQPGTAVPRQDWGVVFLNPGAVRHTGPNRMWVEAARRWAAQGVVSLRVDLKGIGESPGAKNLDVPSLYEEHLVEQAECATDFLRSRTGLRRFVAIGLCSGAYWAFHMAIRNPDIRAAILLNPRLLFWDPAAESRRVMQRTARGLVRWEDWRRLARGGVEFDDIKRAAQILARRFGTQRGNVSDKARPETVAEAWMALEHNRSRLTMVFTEGEPLLRELEQANQLPSETGSPFRCFRIANAGHTFRPGWSQKFIHDLIDREIGELIAREATESAVKAC